MHGNIIKNKPINVESPKVRELYPQYLREAATNVISFLEEYYDYMNREGFPSYELRHVIVENDIDETSTKYLDAIQGEIAKIIPNSTVIDRNTLYKRIVHYYKIKGTPESVDIFFKIFFDSLADIYYPNKDLFKLSEGNFAQDTKYFVSSNVRYNSNGIGEVFSGNNFSIGVTKEPKLGDNFIISFTAFFESAQINDDTYFFTTHDFSPTSEEPGIFDLRRDLSGSFLSIKQDGSSRSTSRIIRFNEDIFDETWRNIRIEYSSNSDDINAISDENGTNITISGTEFPAMDQTYTFQSGTEWLYSGGAADKKLLFSKVSGFKTYGPSEILDGQEYEIVTLGTTNWNTYGADATPAVGETFIASSIDTTDTTTGTVKHRPQVWHLVDDSGPYIRYVDINIDNYHESGGTKGSNRQGVFAAADIIKIKWKNYESGESVETANIKVYSDGNIIGEETIPNNGGYSNASERFSIFSKNASDPAGNNFDARGRLASFKIAGALENNFDYRFTSLDATAINSLNDWSNNANFGKLLIYDETNDVINLATGVNEQWSWDNDQTSFGILPDSLHPLPQVESYLDRGGFASSEKRIQDSEFWQDYSYQISTQTSPLLWKESFSRLVHPSGMKFFILLLIEIVNRSRWSNIISYIGEGGNDESWYQALIPPSKQIINPSEGYHTPKYQPGWLSSAQRAIVIALGLFKVKDEILDPYVNNFVFNAQNSYTARMKSFTKSSKTGFTANNNRSKGNKFAVCGFPLTRPVKNGEQIRFRFKAKTGNSASPMVTLLHNKNDVGEQIYDVLKFSDNYAANSISNPLFNIALAEPNAARIALYGETSPSFANNSPDSASMVASDGVLTLTAAKASSSVANYTSIVRYGNNNNNASQVNGLEDGKSYTITGKTRVVDQGNTGLARVRVDIADRDAEFETSSTSFVDFSLTSVIFPANFNTSDQAQFFDMGVFSGPSSTRFTLGSGSGTYQVGEIVKQDVQGTIVKATVASIIGNDIYVRNQFTDDGSNIYMRNSNGTDILNIIGVTSGASYGVTARVMNLQNTGTISAEFKDIQVIENPKEFKVVRKFESGRCFKVNGTNLSSEKGHQLSTGLTGEYQDITLQSTSDYNQFIAFIDGTDPNNREIDVEGFEIVDVDRNDYPLVDSNQPLSIISVANARYNRKEVFERSAEFGSELVLKSIPFRDSYVFNDYINGNAGRHNPRFWLDERSLSGNGYIGFTISALSLSYTEGIDADLSQANISNPHEAYVKIVTLPISITSSTTAEAVINDPFTYQITAEQSDAPVEFTVIGITNQPSWLTIDASTGEMTGTPPSGTTAETITDFSFRVQSLDGVISDLFSLALTVVLNPINFSQPATVTGTLGTAISNVTLTADQTVATDGWEILEGSRLPLGLSLDSNTGVISGTPYEAHTGTYSATPTFVTTIKVTSVDEAVDQKDITFDFDYQSPFPGITSARTFEIFKDVPFTHTIGTANEAATIRTTTPGVSSSILTAAGADNSFEITQGTLPQGLTLNSATGVISGTPTITGSFGENGGLQKILINYKWFGIQKAYSNNSTEQQAVQYNFVVRDRVPFAKGINDGTVKLFVRRPVNTSLGTVSVATEVFYGDDTQVSANGYFPTKEY